MLPRKKNPFRNKGPAELREFPPLHLSSAPPARPGSADGTLRFLAISDFGKDTPELREVSRAMDIYAGQQPQGVDFVLGLGDNFYPRGVSHVDDELFAATWRDVFLDNEHVNLRVPWRMVLGNHDYMGEPLAQVDYHYHAQNNADRLWYMPSNWYEVDYALPPSSLSSNSNSSNSNNNCNSNSNNNSSSLSSSSSALSSAVSSTVREEERGARAGVVEDEKEDDVLATFFAIDTNACQSHVVWSHPAAVDALRVDLQSFSQRLRASPARWKIVFGHHVMYTQGRGHSLCARCLRDDTYTIVNREGEMEERKGFDLERVCVEGGVDAYFGGHEHVFQYHAKHDVHHFCCGASGADIRPGSGFYGGMDSNSTALDWISTPQHCGFLAAELSATTLVVRFINAHMQTLKEIRVHKN